MRHFSRVLLAYPRFWAIVSAIITVLMLGCLTQISFDVQPSATIASDSQVSRDLDHLHAQYGRDDNDVVVLVEGEGLLEWDRLEQLKKFRDQLQTLPGIDRVASVFDVRHRSGMMLPLIPREYDDRFNAESLLAELAKHPIAGDQMVTRDGRMLVMSARIHGDSLPVSALTSVIEPARRFAVEFEAATGAKVHLAGHTAIRADVLNTLRRAMMISCTAAGVVAFLVALFLFRGLVAVLVVVTPPCLGATWSLGLMACYGEVVGGLLTALPNLVFTIGLTDSVHLLLEMQAGLRSGKSRRNAVHRSLIRVGPACALTSITTIIGFGSLMLSRTDSVAAFGLWTSVGTFLVTVANLVVLPTVVCWIPRRWLLTRATAPDAMAKLVQRLVAPTVRYARITSAVGIGLCAVLIVPALSQRPDIVWTETIPDSSSSAMAMRRADEKMGGALLCYVVVRWPESRELPDATILKATSSAQRVLHESPRFSGTFSIVNVLAAMPGRGSRSRFRKVWRIPPEVRARLYNASDRSLIISARVPNDGASALNERIRKLDAKLNSVRDAYPDFNFSVTGSVVAASQTMNAVIMDLAGSLAVASVLIFFVFWIAFRSLRIGLVSIVPNVLPLLVTAAGLTFFGLPLLITTALTFSLCLGLAVDDSLHMLIRYRAILRHDRDARSAAMKAVAHVGPALIVTTLILFCGFAAMMTSPLPGIRVFAGLSGLTLLTALVGDLFLFPALLSLKGRSER